MDKPPREVTAHSLRWWGQTDRGKIRKNNEDSFLALQFDAQEVNYLGKIGEASMGHFDFTFAVSDGMGGAQAGEFASRVAVEKIAKLLPRSYKLHALGLKADLNGVLDELFEQTHRGISFLSRCYDECAGMGATLSLAWFMPGWMYFAHVGDSRIYYLPAGSDRLKQLTEDDTYVGWLYRKGQINEREARNHPRRNVLQKALGAGHQYVTPQVGAVGFESGDTFLLCTDGVVEGLFDSAILDLLRFPADSTAGNLAQLLVKASVSQSGRDNTTAVVVQIV